MQTTLFLNIPTIGVTGSFGKTTVKEVTAKVLSEKYETYKSRGNFNMVDQTKKHIKNIKNHHEAIVIEMAMSKIGRGRRQCTVIQPNIGVVTAIGHAHFKQFSSLKDVAISKSEMMKYMDPGGVLYLNHDDENSSLINTKYFPGEVKTVGLSEGADYRATNVKYNGSGMKFDIMLNGENENMFVPLFGEHNVLNSVFAISIAHNLGLTANEIREGLKKVKLPRGRLTLKHLNGDRILIDDCYNANPESMISGLNVLDKYIDSPHKIALLGDIAELGSYAQIGHEKVGESLIDFNLEKVFLFGNNSKWILQRAKEVGFPEENLFHSNDLDSLIKEIKKLYNNNTALFVKASRAQKLERVIKYFVSEFKS